MCIRDRVTEFGGILWGTSVAGIGYTVAAGADDFLRTYGAMVDALLDSEVIQGFCYTQLADTEQEVNGLLTADRRPKVDPTRLRAITARPRPSTFGRSPAGSGRGGAATAPFGANNLERT